MVIDAHAHLCRRPRELDRIVASGRLEQVWLMDLDGADLKMYDLATGDEVLQAARDYPGFFIPFGYLDLRGSPDDVDRLRERGFTGLKPYRPAHSWCDERHFPFYERAQALGMPILFHTGMVDRAPRGTIGKGLAHGPDTMRPSHLAAIASAFPDLTVLGGHLGYPWLEETAHNLYFYPNIRHDLSGYRNTLPWLMANLDRKCNDGCSPPRFFSDKILFATDALGYGDPATHARIFRRIDFWELFLEEIGGLYYRWGEPEERAKLLAGNARLLLAHCKGTP